MKKLLLAAILAALPTFSYADPLQQYQPGFRLIDGTQLNKMVNVVNGLTGNSGTASTGYFSANTTVPGPTPQTGAVLQIVGANAATARVELDSYAGPAIYSTVRRNGTKASPTAILSADQIGSFNFQGAASTTAIYGPAARITALATENWSGTAGGTQILLSTTPNTTQTLTTALTLGQDQSATFAGAVAIAGGITSTGTTSASGLTCGSYYFTGTPAATDQVFFIANRALRVVSVSEVHAVAAGGASVLQVTKDTGTSAPGAGTDLLTNNTNTGFDLNGTANTVQSGTLVATAGVTTLAAGDRLAVDFANAIQSSSGVVVTACMAPL